jgi:hypothetical protein
MTDKRRMFTSFEMNECKSDCITFSDNSQGQVLDFGKIAITTKHSISKFLLVKSFDYNLLLISQDCKMGYNYLFTDKGVTIFRRSDCSFAFKGVLRGKLWAYLFWWLRDACFIQAAVRRILILHVNFDSRISVEKAAGQQSCVSSPQRKSKPFGGLFAFLACCCRNAAKKRNQTCPLPCGFHPRVSRT